MELCRWSGVTKTDEKLSTKEKIPPPKPPETKQNQRKTNCQVFWKNAPSLKAFGIPTFFFTPKVFDSNLVNSKNGETKTAVVWMIRGWNQRIQPPVGLSGVSSTAHLSVPVYVGAVDLHKAAGCRWTNWVDLPPGDDFSLVFSMGGLPKIEGFGFLPPKFPPFVHRVFHEIFTIHFGVALF